MDVGVRTVLNSPTSKDDSLPVPLPLLQRQCALRQWGQWMTLHQHFRPG